MISIKGLDQLFDIMVISDTSFRYVVNHPKIKRSKKVPARFLGVNKYGSPRSQEEFRIFASEVRLWQKNIIERHLALKLGKNLIFSGTRLKLIKSLAIANKNRKAIPEQVQLSKADESVVVMGVTRSALTRTTS